MSIELNDLNYSEFIENTDDIVFIDFYSPFCPPCQEVLGILEVLTNYYRDKEVSICKVDVTQNPKLAQKYRVASVPLCVVIGKDKMVKSAEMGARADDVYFGMIDAQLKKKKSFFKKIFGL